MFNSIFDELKKVKYFTRNNKFQESLNVKYFNETKFWRVLKKAEAYLERKRASMMKLFCGYT